MIFNYIKILIKHVPGYLKVARAEKERTETRGRDETFPNNLSEKSASLNVLLLKIL